jgi:hypothetical protein
MWGEGIGEGRNRERRGSARDSRNGEHKYRRLNPLHFYGRGKMRFFFLVNKKNAESG